MSASIDLSGLSDSLGAPKPLELPATRYIQGGRQMFHVSVPLAELPRIIVKRPDPDNPIEGNRKVDAGRAKKFGSYLLKHKDWVSPAIIVRAPSGDVTFEGAHHFPNGTAWGVLKVPLAVLTEILLLDGQHRTLGTFLALEDVNESIRKKTDGIEAAKNNGNSAVAKELEGGLKRLQETRNKLMEEHIAVDIALVTTDQAKQMFADINNNAKGVNPDYTTVLDQRDVINRISIDLIETHDLLKDRVELGQSKRMSSANPNLMGAKNVADIVRAVHVGVGGRIGARVEDELTKALPAAVASVTTFLDVLVAGFAELQAVVDHTLAPEALRAEASPDRTMLGSATMLRALAGVYHDLTLPKEDSADPDPMTRSEIETFFRDLAPYLRHIPIDEADSLWMSTGAFIPGTAAPQARQGSLSALAREMVSWAREGFPENARRLEAV